MQTKRDFFEIINKELREGIGLNMLISGICKPLSMLISYIYVPIALAYLGVEKYGIWSTILTILSWISYCDIGIGNGLRNCLTEALNKNEGTAKKLVSSAYAFVSVIMICIILLFWGISGFIDWNRVLGIGLINEDLRKIVCVSLAFVSINFIFSLCKNVLFSLQKASYVSLLELGIQILNLLGVLILKNYIQENLLCMVIIYGMSMLIVNLACNFFIYLKREDIRPSRKYIDLNEGKKLTSLGIQFFIIQMCALILFSTDSLLISYLYGASNVTPYTMVNKIFKIVTGIYVALLTPIWSAVTQAKAKREWEYIKNLIKKMIIIMIPFLLGTVLLVILFEEISNFWLGQILDYGKVLIILGGCYCVLTIWCDTFASIANGLELMQVSIVIAVLQAILNIPLSIFFAQTLKMESAGILCGTVCVMLISAIAHPLYIRKFIKDNEMR